LATYARYVAAIGNRPSVQHSTLAVWSDSPYTGVAEGEVHMAKGFRLRIREELDFEAGLITSYGYEVYRGEDRLYWYDDFPHPNDSALAVTYPHHKHVPPDIKCNRIPAPAIRTDQPNLSVLVEEVEKLEKNRENQPMLPCGR
jgi:hypothetical protein